MSRESGFFPAGQGFCEIGLASNFSFLRGASHGRELVVAAKLLGLGGIGLADRNSVAGVVRAYAQARVERFAFRPGARLVFADGTPDIFAYPRDRAGWGNLCRLLTLGNLRAHKGECRLFLPDLLDRGAGMNLALLCPDALGGAGWEAAQSLCRHGLGPLREAFPGAVRLAAACRHDGLDARRLERAARLARDMGTPLMATNDVFHHVEERRRMQDVLTAIREHVPLSGAGRLLSLNAERRLKPMEEMAALFRDHPGAPEESRRFFQELSFDLKSLEYLYPDEKLRLGRTPAEELRALAREGAARRYPEGVPETVARQIETELGIIGQLKYEPYFLTVQRIVEAARAMGILCQGRGSAANSTVCYCIGVTEVNPALGGLLFERFISPDRDEPPDIDIDFEHERRDEIMQWIFEEYGRDCAALAATVITYRARSAAREVGRAFGLSDDAVAALSGSVWGYSSSDLGAREARAAGLAEADPTTRNVLDFCTEISGFPRHLSQHVGGFVLTRGRVDETVPVLHSAMEGRTIVEWDKDDLDELGILKIDILALGMLSCLKRGFEMLHEHYRQEFPAMPTLAGIVGERAGDEALYAMTHRADTLGVFQIESRAQMSMLPKLKPVAFYDFVIQVAIVRPGPIQGNMVHPYLKRRMGLEDVSYPSDALKAVLERTKGVPLFQEQAMQIAIVAAGFTPSEADRLRRAMATFKRTGEVGNFKTKMVEGMVANGYERDFAERCFSQIEGFGEYGFPESHAASFALLVYASCWLKCHYPDVFAASILNAQPMGFYAPAQLVRDAREHGVEVRPVCVNRSRWDQTLEPAPFEPSRIHPRHADMAGAIWTKHAVRLGFRQVKGLAEAEMQRLAWICETSLPFDSVRDLWLRTGLSRRTVERLADADAFACLGLSRREALWAARALDEAGAAERLPLFDLSAHKDLQREEEAALPPMPMGEEVVNDYRFLSLSLRAHPLSFLRAELRARSVLPCAALGEMEPGRRVCVAGIVLIRQRPGSARGIIFITVEDETGIANLIVKPPVFERFRPQVLGARLMRVKGRLQADRGVVHVVADTIEDLTPLLSRIAEGGLDGARTLQPTDHVKAPLRAPDKSRAPASPGLAGEMAGAAAALGAALARADEVRRPGPPVASFPKSRDFH
ncbi:error-prone DNA polymerase [Aureimonas populi]|uniref:Error-prone DNA polymerase n=1 Tax=Aureimonas populi TaxID=1701758 RepID=A0ABW5CQD4_9HYPH|nr:error-prone DNA polymerase [Aureimonas populi]